MVARHLMKRLAQAIGILVVGLWATNYHVHAGASASMPATYCEDIFECSNGQVCDNHECVSCDNDPEQCHDLGQYCNGTRCVYGDCDPYDITDSDCFPLVCDPTAQYCYDCDSNPSQCPATTWCQWEYPWECIPIPEPGIARQ